MRHGTLALLIAAALAMSAGAVAAEAPATPSRQAVYNDAQAAYDSGDWGKAVAGFTQVLAGTQKQTRPEAVIRSRLAEALLHSGRLDESSAQARIAVAALRANPSGGGVDQSLIATYVTLGDALRLNLFDEEAIDAYKQAQALAVGPDLADARTRAALGIVLAAIVTHPDLAASAADVILADQKGFRAQPRDLQAQVLAWRAMAELNEGDPHKSLPFMKQAIALNGAALNRVSLSQVAVRGDAALVYEMLHDSEAASEYLTYSGAGHLRNDDWLRGARTDLPACGPEITPEDTAVIEFAIADDGRTAGATPIYASRPGQMGVLFARSVRGWRWRPAAVTRLDGFWRSAIRVQLRCVAQSPAPDISDAFYDATRDWLQSKGVSDDLRDPDSQVVESIGAKSSLRGDVAEIRTLFRHLRGRAAADRLDMLLVQNGAPAEVRALAASLDASGTAAERARQLENVPQQFDRIEGGQRSAAWLRTERAISLETSGRFTQARPLLEAVVQLPSAILAADDPIRNVATLHLSLHDRRAGDFAAAQARIADAGLTDDPCSMLNVRPVPTNTRVSSEVVPDEARTWMFEGWVKEDYNIRADGTVKEVRTVIAYPPFIFGAAMERAVARFRYLPPTFGDTAMSCAGQTYTEQFVVPK
jgi:tetratricopeptide (TPR) repeat protein